MPTVLRVVGAVFVLVLATSGGRATAAETGDAKSRYLSGQSHYNLNEFAEALQDFKEAYRLHPDPAFLFNIAQCERQLGDFDEAIKFYRSYLRNKPDASNAREVNRKIEELKGLSEAKRRSKEGAPQSVMAPATVPPPPPVVETPRAPPPVVAPPPAAVAPAPVAPLTPAPEPTVAPAPNLAPAPEAAASTSGAPGADLTAKPKSSESEPLYTQWWFWAGAGAVVVGAVVIAIVASSGSAQAPSSPLGNKKIF